jgi:hypothetical protein
MLVSILIILLINSVDDMITPKYECDCVPAEMTYIIMKYDNNLVKYEESDKHMLVLENIALLENKISDLKQKQEESNMYIKLLENKILQLENQVRTITPKKFIFTELWFNSQIFELTNGNMDRWKTCLELIKNPYYIPKAPNRYPDGNYVKFPKRVGETITLKLCWEDFVYELSKLDNISITKLSTSATRIGECNGVYELLTWQVVITSPKDKISVIEPKISVIEKYDEGAPIEFPPNI